MDLGLVGRVAIVTGASKGIGKAIAVALAQEGAKVMLSARGQEDLEGGVAEIRAMGGIAEYHAGSVARADDVTALVAETIARFGTVDILVNNAGGQRRRAGFDSLTDQDFLDAFEDNMLSSVRTIRACLPHMRAKQWGRIVNIVSENARQPERTFQHYNAAKAAQLNLTKSLSRLLGKDGILVNSVAPGLIRTPGVEAGFSSGAAAQGLDPEAVEAGFLRKFKSHLALPRPGRVDETAAVVAFLCSERASYITGANYAVDGGAVLGI